MGDKTGIEWTDATWPIVQGCDYESPGCANCYAVPLLWRLMHNPDSKISGPLKGLVKKVKGGKLAWTGKLALREDRLDWPLHWKTPRRIFVPSHGDIFHESVPDAFLDKIFAVMALCPQHTFQVLTKRAARMRDYLSAARAHPVGLEALGITLEVVAENPRSQVGSGLILQGDIAHLKVWPLPNVWLGVSVEDQVRADERIPLLLETPAAKRFLSCEPLLGPVDLTRVKRAPDPYDREMPGFATVTSFYIDALTGLNGVTYPTFGGQEMSAETSDGQGVDWVIVGGESGKDARPMHPDWARSLRDQCQAARVPFFFKQWGEWTPGENVERHRGVVEVTHWFDDAWTFGRENMADEGGHIDDQPDLYRVGKKAAGRRLDGREWSEFPVGAGAAA